MAVQKTAAAPAPGPLASPATDGPRKGPGRQSARDQRLHGRQVRSTASPLTASPRAHPGTNGTDERLRAARERREQQQKSIASREQERVEREQRARFYHQQQLQERQKKLLQQRQKEQQRRAAVEEKRRQKLREERERHQSAVRRTQEKSRKALTQGPSARGRTRTHDAARAAPLTPWEKNLVNRLATPTCSYLARSQSAGCQSGEEGTVSRFRGDVPSGFLTSPCSFVRPFISPCFHQLFIFVLVQFHITPPPPAPTSPPRSPGDHLFLQAQAAVAREASALRRLKPRSRTGVHRELWSGPPRAPGHPLSPRTSDHPRTSTAEQPLLHLIAPPARGGQRLLEQQQQEEAGRLLAEKRRQARLLREQEERERLEREETERRRLEELQRRRAEAQRLVQEKRRREEEEQRRAQEERAQAMREAALLQKQRQEEEEEEAREEARAQQQREDAERQVRRKRLEEIMRRTRRSDSPHTKPAPARALPSDPPPKENTEPVQKVLLETVVKLGHDEDAVPLVAFKERRSIRTRTGLEELQRPQRAEVIS
ncbi:uncharacterized protein ACB058_017345 [Synchiropus picturatus]